MHGEFVNLLLSMPLGFAAVRNSYGGHTLLPALTNFRVTIFVICTYVLRTYLTLYTLGDFVAILVICVCVKSDNVSLCMPT